MSLGSLFLRGLPFCSILFLIMGGCSLRIAGYPLFPALFLAPVYYWVIFRSDWLPLWSLFGIGLIYDSLMGCELGLSSVLLGASSFLGQYTRPFLATYSFPLIWAAFSLYSLGYLFLYGLFMGGGIPLLVSWMYGVILYPLVAWVLSYFYLRLYAYV